MFCLFLALMCQYGKRLVILDNDVYSLIFQQAVYVWNLSAVQSLSNRTGTTLWIWASHCSTLILHLALNLNDTSTITFTVTATSIQCSVDMDWQHATSQPNNPPETFWLVAWRSGYALCRINEVALRRARLVLGWVTVYGQVNHLGLKPAS